MNILEAHVGDIDKNRFKTSAGSFLSFLIKAWFATNFLSAPFILYYGASALHLCPLQPWLPIFLIAQGGLSFIIASLMTGIFLCCNDHEKTTCVFRCSFTILSLLTTFQVVWHFIGCVWVFTTWPEFTEAFKCQYNSYMSAFVLLLIILVLYGVILFASLCFLIGNVFKKMNTEENC